MGLHHDPHWPRAAKWFSTQTQGEIDLAIIGVGAHLSAITPNQAHKTPAAIRDALLRYSTWNQTCQIDFADFLSGADFGDVLKPDDQESTIHELESAMYKCNFLIALGGDNSITFSGVSALAKTVGGFEKVGLITLDAHHDIRDGISNGSPIRQLIEAGLPGSNIVQIGISDFANSKIYAQRAKEYGIHIFDRAHLRNQSLQEVAASAIALAGENHRAIYLDIDMDVCDRSVVPGCPASAPGGLSADELRQIVALISADPRVRVADITEIDTSIDAPDGRTVRLAALVILEMATSRALLQQ
jgi:formimidoylglutamase